MKKEHCHEIEVKYTVKSDKVEKIKTALERLGFTFKSTAKIVDKWLPVGKEWVRLREQKKLVTNKSGETKFGDSKFEVGSKKTIEEDGGLKNKCENESGTDEFIADTMLKMAKHNRRALPTVRKTRTSWTVVINKREYTAVIDHVYKLGRFNGFYFELETLVPFNVDDPSAKSDVKKLASKILSAAYKGAKGKPTKCELMSYRKMALAYQAKQRRTKQIKLKLKQAKPKRSQTKRPSKHHCQ